MNIDEQWDIDRKRFDLPDDFSVRLAFYAGGVHVLHEAVNALPDGVRDDDESEVMAGVLHRLNDDLHGFATRVLAEERSE